MLLILNEIILVSISNTTSYSSPVAKCVFINEHNRHVFFGAMDKHQQHNTGVLYRLSQQQAPTMLIAIM